MNKYLLTIFGFLILTIPSISQQEIEVLEIDWDKVNSAKAYEATEVWEPVPEKVIPGIFTQPPSDAIVLFDGESLEQWHNPKYDYGARIDQIETIIKARQNQQIYSPLEWEIKDGQFIVKPGTGAIETKEKFGSIQLHIEWLSPYAEDKAGQMYNNSGVFLMGLYEIQILNSYENTTYPNGQAGAVYKQHIPEVNASKPPGEWQSYDIIFNAPVFDKDVLVKPAYVTVIHNGVLIQNHVEIEGPCVYLGKSKYVPHEEKLPLLLQDHGDKVRFRNIWVRNI